MADEPVNKSIESAKDANSKSLDKATNKIVQSSKDASKRDDGIISKLGEVIQKADANAKTLSERFTEGFKNTYESLQKNANILGNTKDALKNDFGKLGVAFAPLTAIPGVETALTFLKSVASKLLLKTIQAFSFEKVKFAYEKARDKIASAKSRGKELLGNVKDKGGKAAEIMGKDPKGFSKTLFVGLTTALAVFVKGFIGGFQQALAKTAAFFRLKNLSKSLNTKALKNFQAMGGKITAFGNRIKSFFQPLGKVGKAIQPVVKTITGLLSKVGQFGKLLGKIFFPITVLFTLYEGLKNSMSQYERYSGEGIVSQIFGGILGFLGGVTSYLIGWPLDLLKSAVTWIGDKMGFDMTALEEFSFQDMFKNLYKNIGDGVLDSIQYIKDLWNSIDLSEYFSGLVSRALNKIKTIFMKITAFPKAVASGSAAAVGAFLPGGESPAEAFNRAFNESMQGSVARIEAEQLRGEELQAQSDATTEAFRDVEYKSRSEERDAVKNNVQINNSQSNSTVKKSVPSRQIPSDDFSHRLAIAQ